MKINLLKLILISILFIAINNGLISAEERLEIGIGAGYSDNLYADSLTIGNSYLLNNISFSSAHFTRVRVKMFYRFSYYEYDTNNNISNFVHSPGIAVYNKKRNARFKWGVIAYGNLKDYLSDSSVLNNNRIAINADCSYYFKSGLRLKSKYNSKNSTYANFDILNNIEHDFELVTVKTFFSKTTAFLKLRYSIRYFDEGDTDYNWIDTELKLAQSLNIRTGLSISFLNRVSSEGTRPLSSFFIISGVTSYWDPWDGQQVKLSMKRILPSAVISVIDVTFWDREFSYDQQMQEELPWIEGETGRNDTGWSAEIKLRRQFNLSSRYGKFVSLFLSGGFYSNDSDDSFYSYDNYYFNSNLKFTVF